MNALSPINHASLALQDLSDALPHLVSFAIAETGDDARSAIKRLEEAEAHLTRALIPLRIAAMRADAEDQEFEREYARMAGAQL